MSDEPRRQRPADRAGKVSLRELAEVRRELAALARRGRGRRLGPEALAAVGALGRLLVAYAREPSPAIMAEMRGLFVLARAGVAPRRRGGPARGPAAPEPGDVPPGPCPACGSPWAWRNSGRRAWRCQACDPAPTPGPGETILVARATVPASTPAAAPSGHAPVERQRPARPRSARPHQVLAAALAEGRATPERVAELLRVLPCDVAGIAAGRVGLGATAWRRLLQEVDP